MLLLRYFYSLLTLTGLLLTYKPATCQTTATPELIVQYSNRTSIKKLAFSEDGQILASADGSGLLVLRDLMTHINFASIELQNKEINLVKFEYDKLFICGDYGLEVITVTNRKAVRSVAVPVQYLYYYLPVDNRYIFVGSNGKIYAVNKQLLTGREVKPAFTLLADTRKQLCYITHKNNRIYLLGPHHQVIYDLIGQRVIAEKNITYNLSSYGTAGTASGNILVPSYEKAPLVFSLSTDSITTGIAPGYRYEQIPPIPGFVIGEMGVKQAAIISDSKKTIYLPDNFSASAINKNGILALGDYNGDVVIYDPEKRKVIDQMRSNTSVNHFIAAANRSNMVALAAGNTKTSLIKIIDLTTGKALYEEGGINFDISTMGFAKNDSSLVIVYPNGAVHEIKLTGKGFVKTILKKGAIEALNRNYSMVNFNAGAGQLTSTMQEKDFLRRTERPGRYDMQGKQGYKMALIRAGQKVPDQNTASGKMPPVQVVNGLINQFKLDKEAALFDQLERDLFVMGAISYDRERFMKKAADLKINLAKAKALYDQLHSSGPGKDQFRISGPGITSELVIELDERPRGIVLDALNKTVYLLGKEKLTRYSLLNKTPQARFIKFRKSGDISNYTFDTNHNHLFVLQENKVVVYDLKNMRQKFNYYSFAGSVLYQSPEGYYYTTSRVPQMAFRYKGNIIQFDQFDIRYNRPDKVLQAMGSSDTALIGSYRRAYEKRIQKLRIDTSTFKTGYSVPEADFTNREQLGYEQHKQQIKLHITGRDSIVMLDRFNVWVNECPVFGMAGASLKSKNTRKLDTVVTIDLNDGNNRLETSLINANGIESYRIPLLIEYKPAELHASKLYFVGIGIDRFAESRHNLNWSVKDISDMAFKFKEKYRDRLLIDTFYNQQVTKANISALKKKLSQTTVNDKVVIAYSGHGLLSKSYDYYLSTYPVNFTAPERDGMPYDVLEGLMDSIPARKKLMLIDACHSGELDKAEMQQYKAAKQILAKNVISRGAEIQNTDSIKVGLKNSFELMQSLFVNVGRSTGATIVSAASGTQLAFEKNELKNGVFTFSLLEYMKDNPHGTVSALKQHINSRVTALTQGLQVPTMRSEPLATDWDVW